MASKTLLEKLLERRAKRLPNETISQDEIEQGQIFVAWVEGIIDSSEVCAALDIKSTGQICQKAGTMLRNLCRGRYITITWNQEESIGKGPTKAEAEFKEASEQCLKQAAQECEEGK
jgi:hypothetical protein